MIFSKRSRILTVISVVFASTLCAQSPSSLWGCQDSDTLFISNSVYDFFTGQEDSFNFYKGKIRLMEFDSIDMEGNNEYRFEYKHDDELKVYFKEHPLFSHEVENGQLKGSGYCFYPFEKRVAVQAEFRKSKLHGLVVVQDRNGKLLEIMKYKKGKYVRHLFHFNIKGEKGLRKYSRDHTGNPLLGDEVIEI
jgi:hypothetical protein